MLLMKLRLRNKNLCLTATSHICSVYSGDLIKVYAVIFINYFLFISLLSPSLSPALSFIVSPRCVGATHFPFVPILTFVYNQTHYLVNRAAIILKFSRLWCWAQRSCQVPCVQVTLIKKNSNRRWQSVRTFEVWRWK